MSHISKLKLSKTAPFSGKITPQERARTKVLDYLERQRSLVQGQLSGQPYTAYKTVYRTKPDGERVRVQEPMHVRRGWFEANGTTYFAIRYGAKSLPLDKAGSSAVEIGELASLPDAIDTLAAATRAGELDTALSAAVQDRRKHFTKRRGTKVD